MTFMDVLKEVALNDYNFALTENGAVGYKTTGKALLDLNFQVTSLRGRSPKHVEMAFIRAMAEDPELALRWLFFARDIRGGLGERRLFRIAFTYFARSAPQIAQRLIPLVPEYGRFDDLWPLLNTENKPQVIELIQKQLTQDLHNLTINKPISLLAKWLPSESASSKETQQFAKQIYKALQLTPRHYRKILSSLRNKLNLVETAMSSKEWSHIRYEQVPSRANLIYNAAFLRNDEERRRNFLAALQKGETKINAATLFPHDIVAQYAEKSRLDITLEQLWKALPNYVNEDSSTLVVADGSGSMQSCVGNTKVSALVVANALAIYFAERCSGQFRNKYITFSMRPQLVNLGDGSLRDKIRIALNHTEVANTNIEAVFDLILKTAIRSHASQSEIPKNVLIISDMEFDSCTECNSGRLTFVNKTLFQGIEAKYAAAGYKLPRLVFWNVDSRTGTIPVRENDLGVALVSGFSPAVAKMVLSNKLDPYEVLIEAISAERYDAISEALNS